jgi:hypothetical protein
MKTLIISPFTTNAERKLMEIQSDQFNDGNVLVYTRSSLKTNEDDYHVVSFSSIRGHRADRVLVDSRSMIGDVFATVLPVVNNDIDKIELF